MLVVMTTQPSHHGSDAVWHYVPVSHPRDVLERDATAFLPVTETEYPLQMDIQF